MPDQTEFTGALCGTCEKVRLVRRTCLCGKRRRFVVWWGGDYYGLYGTCLKCGEEFGGDEWLERPFRRRWRQENIAKAKALLARYEND